jgi:predicted dehydrogenase
MERVKVGVVGLGWISQVAHIPVLSRLPEADLVAACDVDKGRGRLVGEKFGIERVYVDLQQMMEHEDLDAIVVATSTDAHKETTLAALEAGKDVLVEKPIARRFAEAAAIAEAAKQHKRKVMVGMNHRFRPDTMILKSFIEGKELGKVFHTKAGWLRRKRSDIDWVTQKEKSGGGVFLDLGIVMLDMAFWMMGYPDVKGVSATHFHHTTRNVEDTSIVSITMKNGSLITIEVSWSMTVGDDLYYCNIYGTDGTATLSPLQVNKELHGSLVNLAPAKIDPPGQLFKKSYENELRHFLGAVKGLHPIVSTADEAVQRMQVVDAVYKSARTRKEVIIR